MPSLIAFAASYPMVAIEDADVLRSCLGCLHVCSASLPAGHAHTTDISAVDYRTGTCRKGVEEPGQYLPKLLWRSLLSEVEHSPAV